VYSCCVFVLQNKNTAGIQTKQKHSMNTNKTKTQHEYKQNKNTTQKIKTMSNTDTTKND
jgi:hypothetical protein